MDNTILFVAFGLLLAGVVQRQNGQERKARVFFAMALIAVVIPLALRLLRTPRAAPGGLWLFSPVVIGIGVIGLVIGVVFLARAFRLQEPTSRKLEWLGFCLFCVVFTIWAAT